MSEHIIEKVNFNQSIYAITEDYTDFNINTRAKTRNGIIRAAEREAAKRGITSPIAAINLETRGFMSEDEYGNQHGSWSESKTLVRF